MAPPATTSPPTPAAEQSSPSPRRWPLSRRWTWALIGVLVAVGAWWGPSLAVQFTNSRARAAIQARKPELALAWLARSRQILPRNAEAAFLRARAYRKQGEYSLVRENLLQAQALGYPVDILEREQHLAAAQNGQLREALPHFPKLLMDPRNDGQEICEAYSVGFYTNRRLEDFFRTVEPWMKDYPDDPQPWYLRGKILAELQKYAQAEGDFREALKRDPQMHAAAFELGDLLVNLKRPEEAIPWFQQAQQDSKIRAVSLAGEAKCHKMLAHPDEARRVLLAGLQEFPQNNEILQSLGQIELEAGEYADALKHLDLARDGGRNDYDLHYARASALRGLKRMPEAQEEFAYVNKARTALDRAHKMAEEISGEQTNVAKRCEIGEIYLTYGSPVEGIKWLQSIFNIDPDYVPAHAALLKYYESRVRENPAYRQWVDYHKKFVNEAPGGQDTSPPAAPVTPE